MNYIRRQELELTDTELTQEEIKEGYHFCPEFDYLVIGDNDPEIALCTCSEKYTDKLKGKAWNRLQ